MMIRVFLANDNALVRDSLRALLESNPDITVVGEAANGCHVLSQVQHLQPDVVIMDISMPELNGISAAQYILKDCPDSRVIILANVKGHKHVYQSLQVGAQGYLLLESAGREAIEAVLEVYAGKVYLSQPIKQTLVADYLYHRGELKQ
jgi:DNA-binding NarL/FixJ family response regulator